MAFSSENIQYIWMNAQSSTIPYRIPVASENEGVRLRLQCHRFRKSAADAAKKMGTFKEHPLYGITLTLENVDGKWELVFTKDIPLIIPPPAHAPGSDTANSPGEIPIPSTDINVEIT